VEPRTRHLTREEIRATVVSALLSGRAGQPQAPALIDDQTAIGGTGLGISSLNILQALVRIEDELGIVFDDRAVAEAPLNSVGTVVDLVERVLARKEN
jgi:acyl carrier protein